MSLRDRIFSIFEAGIKLRDLTNPEQQAINPTDYNYIADSLKHLA